MLSRRSLLASLAAVPALRWSASAADAPADDLRPILTEGTFAVVDLHLAGANFPDLVGTLVASPAGRYLPERLKGRADRWTRDLKAAGIVRLRLLFDLADMPGPPILAVPLDPGADSQKQLSALGQAFMALGNRAFAGDICRGWNVLGRPGVVVRLRGETPTSRPDILAALAEGDPGAAIRVAISPGRSLRRTIAEAMPTLPGELGGGPTRPLTQGIAWASLVVSGNLRAGRLTVQADSLGTAEAFHRIARLGLGSLPVARETGSQRARVQPTLDGHRIVADIAPETILALVAAPLGQARLAIERAEAMNRLKTLGLALHNYHHQYGSFPPAYRADPTGRPLLSWRVLILPYLDQDELFKQFKLDEPWDGPTNQPLIARMPPALAAPSLPAELAAEGKTAYLTARGPETAFPGAGGVRVAEFGDGTDSTILVLEAGAAEAVPWTKPDDWDAASIPAALPRREWAATLGDGSARRFRAGVSPAVIQALLTRKGGEAIDWTNL